MYSLPSLDAEVFLMSRSPLSFSCTAAEEHSSRDVIRIHPASSSVTASYLVAGVEGAGDGAGVGGGEALVGLGVLWGLGLVSLVIAMAFQKMLPVILGWLLAVAGALLFVNVWVDNSVIGFVSWIGFTVITVAVGIASLRTQETG